MYSETPTYLFYFARYYKTNINEGEDETRRIASAIFKSEVGLKLVILPLHLQYLPGTFFPQGIFHTSRWSSSSKHVTPPSRQSLHSLEVDAPGDWAPRSAASSSRQLSDTGAVKMPWYNEQCATWWWSGERTGCLQEGPLQPWTWRRDGTGQLAQWVTGTAGFTTLRTMGSSALVSLLLAIYIFIK